MIEAIDKALKKLRRNVEKNTPRWAAYTYVLARTVEATSKAQYIQQNNHYYAFQRNTEGESDTLYSVYLSIRDVIESTQNSPTMKTSRLGMIRHLQDLRNESNDTYERHINHAMNLLTQPIESATVLTRLEAARKQYDPRSDEWRAYKDAEVVIREGFGL